MYRYISHVFVERKVISTSYSSTILKLLPLPFIFEISPMVLSFVPIHLKTNTCRVSTVCQGMLDAGDVAVNKREMVAALMGLSV